LHAQIAATERLNVIAAVLPGPWHPGSPKEPSATGQIVCY
jgi:hypothetical protein